MGQVLQFPVAAWRGAVDDDAIDLLTAVDVAIRDLSDIIVHIGMPAAREQAEACRDMLQSAFDAAVAAG
jgi:hypothetical protein